MKVLHIIETLGKGGAEQALVNLLPSLQEIGVTCHVAVLNPPLDLAEKINQLGITLHFLNISHRWNIISAILKVSEIAKENEYDIIHSHLFFPGIYSALSKLLVKKPKRISSYHNLDYDSYPANTLHKKIRKYLDKFCTNKLIDSHCAVSNAVSRHYTHHLNIKISEVIPNPIPVIELEESSLNNQLENFLDKKNNYFYILLAGRLVHEKGHRYAIEAIKKLISSRVKAKLIIVGDGPLKKALETEIKKEAFSSYILMNPALEQKELFNLMGKVDCCIFPSTHEGWGLVAAEAMALGKPVIASKVGGLAEIIAHNETGILIRSKSTEELASAIEYVMCNKAMSSKMANNAKKEIIQLYSPKKVAYAWKGFYEKTIASC